MKILLATDSYYPNIDGGAVAQHRLVHKLVEKGHKVGVIAPGHDFKNKKEKDKGSLIFRTRSLTLPFYMDGRYNFSPFPFLEARKFIKQFNPDIVNICSPYPNSICSFYWAKKLGIPVVGSIHILPENILTPFKKLKIYDTLYKYTWKYLVNFFNRVNWTTAPTETGAKMYKEKGLKTPVTAISNGVNIDNFNPDRNGDYLRDKIGLPDKKIVLYTGRINPEKNLEVVINAIPEVIKEEPDIHFLFCGSGGNYKKEIIGLTEKLNVSDNITFIDFLEWEDYKNVYSLADLFVMPAEAELQSIVTLEAIASGLPAVVVDKGAVPELVKKDNGFLFEPGNSEQLADRMVSILSDEKLRKKMGENSLEVAKNHSRDYVVSKYIDVYRKVLNGN